MWFAHVVLVGLLASQVHRNSQKSHRERERDLRMPSPEPPDHSTIRSNKHVTQPHRNGAQLYCWNSDTGSATLNQSCLTGEKWPGNIVSLFSGETNQTETNNNNRSESNTTHCLAYVYQTVSGDLVFDKDPVKARILHKNISCDFNGLCKDRPMGQWIKINETIDQIPDGEIFCCDTSNCNSFENLPTIPKYKRVCQDISFNGTFAYGHDDVCDSPDTRCVRMTLYKDNAVSQQLYKCDNENTCKHGNLTNITLSCKTETFGEQCCCLGDKCLPKPPYKVHSIEDGDSTNFTINIHKVIKQTKSHGHPDWLFIGGIIAAAVLIVVFLVAVGVIVKRCKKKETQRNGVTLSYTRIAADSVPEDEDVQMLLS